MVNGTYILFDAVNQPLDQVRSLDRVFRSRRNGFYYISQEIAVDGRGQLFVEIVAEPVRQDHAPGRAL